MNHLENEISTGYAINGAFMYYIDNEIVTNLLQNNSSYKALHEEYNKIYDQLLKILGKSFFKVDELLNNLRLIHELESELFYRIGIHNGISICKGDFITQNLSGAE